MQTIWQDIMDRWLNTEKWSELKVSPLESVIYEECSSAEDKQRLQDHRLRLMLADIQKREAEAAEYGDGEQDTVLSVFAASLRKKQDSAARVYSLLRQGLSREQIRQQLAPQEGYLEQAEDRLLQLYVRANMRSGNTAPGTLHSPGFQTWQQLQRSGYRVLRQDTTGAVHYRFCHHRHLLGTGTAMVLPGFPVTLQGGGLFLCSSMDPDQTVVPGMSREILDADNATESVARLTWLGKDRYHLTMNWATGTQTVRIHFREGEYNFWLEDRLIARISPLPQPQKLPDWDLGWCMRPYEQIPDATALLLLSFPLLRFA